MEDNTRPIQEGGGPPKKWTDYSCTKIKGESCVSGLMDPLKCFTIKSDASELHIYPFCSCVNVYVLAAR